MNAKVNSSSNIPTGFKSGTDSFIIDNAGNGLRCQGVGDRDVVISDLTYARVGTDWNYICVLIDLFNREIIGYSAGEHKTAELVKEAFQRVEGSLQDIRLSHTDR